MGGTVFCSQLAEGDLVIIEVAGELDMESAAGLRDCLIEAEELEPERTIVDLSEVEFMDSAALGVLVVVARRLFLSQRDLALVSPEGPARRLMHIAGLDAVVPLFATREQALMLGATS